MSRNSLALGEGERQNIQAALDRQRAAELGLPGEFLRPVLPSPRHVPGSMIAALSPPAPQPLVPPRKQAAGADPLYLPGPAERRPGYPVPAEQVRGGAKLLLAALPAARASARAAGQARP